MAKYEDCMRPLGQLGVLEENLVFMGVDMVDKDTPAVWRSHNG